MLSEGPEKGAGRLLFFFLLGAAGLFCCVWNPDLFLCFFLSSTFHFGGGDGGGKGSVARIFITVIDCNKRSIHFLMNQGFTCISPHAAQRGKAA